MSANRTLRAFFAALALAGALAAAPAPAQVINPGVQQSGAVTFGNCTQWGPGVGQISDAGAACGSGGAVTPANPSATAGPSAINGAAATYMRSDAAPAVQLGTNAQFGIVEGDSVSVSCVLGVCSAVAQPTLAVNYGVKCDNSTDDSAAIVSAIAATPYGGTLILPAGTCLITGSGSQIFSITQPINIRGQGRTATALQAQAAVPNTRDIFHIVGVTDTTTRGYGFSDFSVTSTAAVGKNIFHFDSTAGTTTNLADITIARIHTEGGASAGGSSIHFDNGTGTNTNGGIFNVTVWDCYIGGGINSAFAGDTIRVIGNILSSINPAVTINQVANAGQFIVSGNNVSGDGGGVVVVAGFAPIIENNQFEQQATNIEANNSIIDLIGTRTISNAKIVNNQVASNPSMGNPTLIRVAAASNTIIDGNRLATPAVYAAVVLTSSASNTVIGAGNFYSGSTSPPVTDGSTTTIYTRSQNYTGHSLASATACAAGGTCYIFNDMNTVESSVYGVNPLAGYFRQLNVYTPGAPGVGQTYTFVLRNNLGNTTITCTISGNAANSCSDTTHSAATAATDRWDIRVVLSAGATALANVTWSVNYFIP